MRYIIDLSQCWRCCRHCLCLCSLTTCPFVVPQIPTASKSSTSLGIKRFLYMLKVRLIAAGRTCWAPARPYQNMVRIAESGAAIAWSYRILCWCLSAFTYLSRSPFITLSSSTTSYLTVSVSVLRVEGLTNLQCWSKSCTVNGRCNMNIAWPQGCVEKCRETMMEILDHVIRIECESHLIGGARSEMGPLAQVIGLTNWVKENDCWSYADWST